MKRLTAIAFLMIAAFPAYAMDDLRITVQGTNVMLSWPSAGFEAFVVRYRPDLQPGSAWVTLTNNYTATPGTNRTAFTHRGGFVPAVPCGGGGGGGGAPPPPGGASILYVPGVDGTVEATTEPDAYRQPRLDAQMTSMPRTDVKDIPWPPLPEPLWDGLPPEERARQEAMAAAAAVLAIISDSPNSQESDGPSCGVSTGFYQVFLVPDTWFDYTQGYQFTQGIEFVPIYLGVDADIVSKVELLVDGQVCPYTRFGLDQVDFGSGPEWTYGLWFHHHKLLNGSHQLQVRSTIRLGTAMGESTSHLTMIAPAFTTSLNNPIVMNSWENLIVGTTHTFKAYTTIFPATWRIDLFDVSGQLVRSQTGSTSDGNISWTWNLRDTANVLRDNVESDPFFDPYVTVTGTISGVTVARPADLTAVDYPYTGGWIVAYQDKDKFVPLARTALMASWLAIAGGPSGAGIPTAAVLLKYGRPGEVDMPSSPLNAMIARNASWDELRARLLQPVFRNLYINAHGSGFELGGDWDALINEAPYGLRPIGAEADPNVYTNANQIVRTRAFLSSGWCYQLSPTFADAPQPYRFVFLDGCGTATGDWPSPFGIPPMPTTLSYYQIPDRAPNTRPSTFVGWSETTYYSDVLNTPYKEWGDYQQYAFFRSQWMHNWRFVSQTPGLASALARARSDSNWISANTYNRVIRIYGYTDLRFEEYNRRGDWP